MADLYLKKKDQNYYIYVLGKNGEPKEKVSVEVTLHHSIYSYLNLPKDILITDSDGKVKIGNLSKFSGSI